MRRFTVYIISIFALIGCNPDDSTNYSQYQDMTPDPKEDGIYSQYNDENYIYAGVLDDWGSNHGINDLVGTKWLISRIYNGYPYTTTDYTLTFLTGTTYQIDSLEPRTYTFSDIVGVSDKSLTFNFFTPLGGSNYSGQVGAFFIEDGMVNGNKFYRYYDQSTVFKIWMEKI